MWKGISWVPVHVLLILDGGHGVQGDFNKFHQLRFGRMGRSGQSRTFLVSLPRTGTWDGLCGGLVETTKGHTEGTLDTHINRKVTVNRELDNRNGMDLVFF